MAFDGAGTFLRLYSWVVDATNSVKIRADRHDAEDNNFAAGLSNCITKDGQTAITQNIPWNSRRLISLADPIDPQDAATKDYADTKIAKTGDGTITGNLTVTGDTNIGGALTVAGNVTANGYAGRTGTGGVTNGFFYNFNHIGGSGTAELWINTVNLGALATQVYVNNSAATKLPLTGGTITGSLQVNGEVGSGSNIYRFGAVGSSPGYLQWNGGGTYTLGGAGTVWHSGNFNPAALGTVSDARLAIAGDFLPSGNNLNEPFSGAVCSMVTNVYPVTGAVWVRFRYLQINKGSGFVTVGYA